MFERKSAWWAVSLCVVSLILVSLNRGGAPLGFATQDYPLGFLSIILVAIGSFGLVYLFTHINRRSSFIVDVLEWIGHNSIFILCLHGVEYAGACWYHTFDILKQRPVQGCIIMFVARCTLIAFRFLAIQTYKRYREKAAVI